MKINKQVIADAKKELNFISNEIEALKHRIDNICNEFDVSLLYLNHLLDNIEDSINNKNPNINNLNKKGE